MSMAAYAGVVACAFAVLIAVAPTPTMAQGSIYPAFPGQYVITPPSHHVLGNEYPYTVVARDLDIEGGGGNFGVAARAGGWQQPAGAGSGSKRSNARSGSNSFRDPTDGQGEMTLWYSGNP